MNALLSFLFSSIGAVSALVGFAAWLWARPSSRVARRLLTATALLYLAASTYIVPFVIARALTHGYTPLDAAAVPPGDTALVILGSGAETVFGWHDRLDVPGVVEAERIVEAWRVYRMIAPRWVISSGGNPDPADVSEPSSVNMRRELVHLGVPQNRIVLQSTSRNTHEEAMLDAQILRSVGAQRVVAVTSAVHMRRTVGAFRAAGVHVIPAIAPDSHSFDTWPQFLIPGSHAIYFSGEVAHELFGLPYYFARGWLK